jgi:hypothetical protein
MDAEQFAHDPWSAREEGYNWCSVPSEWVSRAWETNQEFREECVGQFVRSLDKQGTFYLAEGYAELLQVALTREQVLQLHSDLCAQSGRNQMEWRLEFEQRFPQALGQVPPIQREELRRYDYARDFLITIQEHDINRVSYLIQCLRGVGRRVDEVKMPDLAELGLTEYEIATMNRTKLKNLIEDLPPSAWKRLSEIAREMGDEPIARMLEEAEKRD